MIFTKPPVIFTLIAVVLLSCGCCFVSAVIPPGHAGSWYKRDPRQLQEQLNGFLNQSSPIINSKHVSLITSSNPTVSPPVLAIICPHAGYPASGLAAAHAYKLVSAYKFERVFILAPRHRAHFHGALLPSAHTFITPIGNLQVDQAIEAKLLKSPLFNQNDKPYKVEHSLEMQLPFIRKVFGNIKIVPILIGSLDGESEIRALGKTIRGCVSKNDLVVVSSDFTHYGVKYKYVPFTDNIMQNIAKLDSHAYSYISRLDITGFLDFKAQTSDTICGYRPCAVLMSMLPPNSKCTLLDYYTCQDSERTLDKYGYSVSYMAIAFSGSNWEKTAL